VERDLSEEMGIFVTIHMDPLNVDDEEVVKTRREIEAIVKKFPEVLSLHDLRVVGSGERKNVIFDVVVSNDVREPEEEAIKNRITAEIKKAFPGYNPVITVDRHFI